MQVIGICGQAQHGKDTFAAIARNSGWRRYAFADNVRRALWALNPLVGVDPAGAEFSLRTLVENEGGTAIGNVGSGPGWDRAKQQPEVRRLLQQMGTEAVRDVISTEAWVMALKKQLDEEQPERVLITDVRFPNEAEAVRSWGGRLLRVVRLNADRTVYQTPGIDLTHASERFVRDLRVDYEIRARSVAELTEATQDFLTLTPVTR